MREEPSDLAEEVSSCRTSAIVIPKGRKVLAGRTCEKNVARDIGHLDTCDIAFNQMAAEVLAIGLAGPFIDVVRPHRTHSARGLSPEIKPARPREHGDRRELPWPTASSATRARGSFE